MYSENYIPIEFLGEDDSPFSHSNGEVMKKREGELREVIQDEIRTFFKCRKSTVSVSISCKSKKSNLFQRKGILVGHTGVGKTSICRSTTIDDYQFQANKPSPTVGQSVFFQDFKVDDYVLSYCYFDTSGQERFFRNTDVVFFVYDITCRNSFERISSFWVQVVHDNIMDLETKTVVVVGNKIDKVVESENKLDGETERAGGVVSYDEGFVLAQRIKTGALFFETSCKTGENLNECFLEVLRHDFKKVKITQLLEDDEDVVVLDCIKRKKKKKKCCP